MYSWWGVGAGKISEINSSHKLFPLLSTKIYACIVECRKLFYIYIGMNPFIALTIHSLGITNTRRY